MGLRDLAQRNHHVVDLIWNLLHPRHIADAAVELSWGSSQLKKLVG
jgi:hypothetical protein